MFIIAQNNISENNCCEILVQITVAPEFDIHDAECVRIEVNHKPFLFVSIMS